jgi:hypothetical protein
MLLGLDQLLFNNKIISQKQAEMFADAIDNYLQSCGWSFELILQQMLDEIATTPNTKSN